MKQESQTKIKKIIRALLNRRGPGKSICPSEAARNLDTENWRMRMEEVRQVGREMAKEGEIIISQKEKILDPKETWKGAIRFRWPGPFRV